MVTLISLLFSDKKAPNATPREISFMISQNVLKKLYIQLLGKIFEERVSDSLCVSYRIRCDVVCVLSLETRHLCKEKGRLFESDIELLH